MIAVALFTAGALSYLLAIYWREESVGDDGSARTGRRMAYLMLNTMFLTVAAVVVSVVQMITDVLPA